MELKEFIKIENEIYEIKNDRIGRNEEIPLKRSRKVKHMVPTFMMRQKETNTWDISPQVKVTDGISTF